MKVCCFRVFVKEVLWDCIFIVKHIQNYDFFTTVYDVPFRVSAELQSLQFPSNEIDPLLMNGNCLEQVIKIMEQSAYFRKLLVRKMNTITSVDNNNITISVQDINLVEPKKYRLPYTWCNIYEKTDLEYRELENIMAWLSTLGGAFSSLGDQTEHCAIVAGKISIQQLKIALRIGDPITVARCKLYLAISLMQRGQFNTAKSIVKEQYFFVRSQTVIDERLIKMCYGIWCKLRYEKNKYYSIKSKIKKTA
ncbi:uncharacterized protein LOC126905046 [Daktulosphaira vitifoliae]|uniref:uncharacterized protein LOC126905046 n=1 Tax=Daktulosphaira vitifoliae TaxID=58002 RepID=UPI0021A97EAC|nr:uncharacterized protein LOC126905046 [Daktulosphaira vitifoliae]